MTPEPDNAGPNPAHDPDALSVADFRGYSKRSQMPDKSGEEPQNMGDNNYERPVRQPKPTKITAGDVRMAVLPDWDGATNEHVLDGACSKAEALALYQKHYEGTEHSVAEVSAGEAFTATGKTMIWLPVLQSWGQQVKSLKNVNRDLRAQVEIEQREIVRLHGYIDSLEGALKEARMPWYEKLLRWWRSK